MKARALSGVSVSSSFGYCTISSCSGISVLDLPHDPPAHSYGDGAVHPDWFYTRCPHPGTHPTHSSLHTPYELPRAQRMALRCVRCATIEHRRGAWRPDPVCFHQVDHVTKLRRVKQSLNKRKGSIRGRLALLMVAGTLALNTAATVLLTRASMANYPGGTALALLNKRYADRAHGRSTLLPLCTCAMRRSAN